MANNFTYDAFGNRIQKSVTYGENVESTFYVRDAQGYVMATISDRKIGVDENSDTQIDYYIAEVLSQNDYYPFGMGMLICAICVKNPRNLREQKNRPGWTTADLATVLFPQITRIFYADGADESSRVSSC